MRAKINRVDWFLIFLVIFSAQSCQVQRTTSVVPKPYVIASTKPAEILATVSPTPIRELRTNPTSPSAMYTPIPSPTILVTPTVMEKMQVLQLEVIDWEASQIDLTGSIVISGNYVSPLNPDMDRLDQDSVILNLQTQERIVLAKAGEDPIFVYDVSPDGRWLAYEVLEPKEIVITSSDGQEAARISMQQDWGHNGFLWLNNETLAISQSLPRPNIKEDRKGVAGAYALVLYNPFTGDNSVIQPDFPGIGSLRRFLDWYLSGMLLDPNMDYLIYRMEDSELPFVLWNIRENKEVLQFPFGDHLKWSPDGKVMAYVRDASPDLISNELYLIDLQGLLTRLTTLNDKFSEVVIPYFQWSPDGKQIVIWFYSYSRKVNSFYIGVINIEIGTITIYDSNDRFEGPFPIYLERRVDQSPIWSPDSSKLLVVEINPDDENQRDIIVIDLVTDTAVKIAENRIPVGWMK